MMKIIATLFFVAFAINSASATEMRCSLEQPVIPTEWIDLKGECYTAMRAQIQKEIDASFTYLSMAAHFSRDTVNRPGFASMFFTASKEEREHASKLIEYLSMRGTLTNEVTNLIKIPTVNKHAWGSASEALEEALVLETSVTQSIRKLIQTCEKKPNYYHLVDYLTGEFMEEQLKGQRDLAGKLNTLKKMMVSQGALAEFLFDKDLSE